MTNSITNKPGQPKTAEKSNDQHGQKPTEGQANTTGTRPGMPQRDEQGKHQENEGRGTEASDPNPGPGVTTQGHRVDEDTPAQGNDQDAGRQQPSGERNTELEEQAERHTRPND